MSEKSEERWPRGCLQIYTGDGKGKTTAAAGLALRAVGAGLRVYFGQFLKSRPSGEVTALLQLGVVVERFGSGGWPKPKDAQASECAQRGLSAVLVALTSGQYDLVVADEILGALRLGLLELDAVLHLTLARLIETELVLTGRDAPQELLDRADLVTRMQPEKHYFSTGLPARKGIEY